MKKKNKILISIIAVVVILLVIGVSYALWIITKEQNGENIVNTACLEISIDDEANISLQKAFPIEDSEGEKLKPYTFTVTNKCNDLATYQINLESLNKVSVENRLDSNYLKVKLNEVGQDGIKDILGNLKTTDITIADTYEAHKLMTGHLEPNDIKHFELRLWIDENVTKEDGVMDKQFKSKISVTSTYIEEDDVPPTSSLALSVCNNTITAQATASAYKNKNITQYEYNIDDNGWNVGEEVQEFTEQQAGNHNIKLRVTDNLGVTSEEVEQSINIKEDEFQDMYGKQIKVTSCKDGLYKVEHDDLEELGAEWSQTEYRYAGVNPDNYVSFNNEIWRIIGLVNVKTDGGVEQRLKIVRVDGVNSQKDFGAYAWSTNNNWVAAALKNMLNGIYYESGEGECYTGESVSDTINTATKTTCNFSGTGDLPKGLDDTSRNMIDKEVIWNLGGWEQSRLTPDQYYEKERGKLTGDENRYESEWSNETDIGNKHNGIGIIYISDYGYATNGGNIGRDICFDKMIYLWRDVTENLYDYKNECAFKDWLKPNEGFIWGLMPLSQTYNGAFFISARGYVDRSYYNSVSDARKVWPTAYLTKNVTITSGEGTIDLPYELQLNA